MNFDTIKLLLFNEKHKIWIQEFTYGDVSNEINCDYLNHWMTMYSIPYEMHKKKNMFRSDTTLSPREVRFWKVQCEITMTCQSNGNVSESLRLVIVPSISWLSQLATNRWLINWLTSVEFYLGEIVQLQSTLLSNVFEHQCPFHVQTDI